LLTEVTSDNIISIKSVVLIIFSDDIKKSYHMYPQMRKIYNNWYL